MEVELVCMVVGERVSAGVAVLDRGICVLAVEAGRVLSGVISTEHPGQSMLAAVYTINKRRAGNWAVSFH